MIKVSRLVLAALFVLLVSGMSFGQEMGAGESGPGTGGIGGSSASMIVDPSIFGSSSSTGGTDWSKCTETVFIGTAGALKEFASSVNNGNTSLCGRLTDDIDLNGGKDNQWTPIGTETNQFVGTFDGQGHTIKGLYVDNVNMDYVGLFGNVARNGVVKNVGVMDSHIKGWAHVGGVVGNNESGSVSNVYNTGFVNGEWDVGGVVGYNGGIVSNVYNTGAVSGTSEVGGVVGGNNGTVSNAYYNTDFYAGNAVGGGGASGENVEGKTTLELASKTLPDGFDENVWVAGSISIGDDGSVTFGLPYLNGQSSQLTFKLEMDVNKYLEISTALQLKLFAQLVNSGETSINGKLTADICLNACNKGDKPLLEQIAGLGENGDISTLGFNQWTPIGTDKNGYLGTFDGNGHTIRGLYFNDESTDYVGLFGYISPGATVQNVGVIDSYIRGNNSVGGVVGDNDGGTVSNVYNTGSVNGEWYVGGVVGENDGGTISNVYNTGSVSGDGDYEVVGGVVGYNTGIISNVYNTGSVSGYEHVGGVVGCNLEGAVSNVYNTGSVNGSGYNVGGVVGSNNEGTVSNVYNTGSVSGDGFVGGVVGVNYDGSVSNVYNTGSVSGDGDYGVVGGVVGYNNGGTISNAYNTGFVSGTGDDVGGVVGYNYAGTISNVYNTGSVSGHLYVGGVVGYNNYGTISNVYNTGSVSGSGNAGGVVGYNDNGTVSNGFFNTEVTCENCFVVEGATGKSSEEFADGTVARLLHDWCEMDGEVCKYGGLNGSIWGQDLTAENSLPDFSGVAIEKYGSIIFYVGVDKVDSASIDAAAKDLVTIPNDVVVAGPVKFKRTFAGSGYSTIMLPFTPNCTDDDCVEGVKFYEFNSYTDGEVQATEVSQKDLKANTPYLVQVTGASEIVFKNGGTFNTTTSDAYDSEIGEYKVELGGDGAGWTIYGTYAYKTWKEGDAGLGKTYGFAGAADNDPSIVGQFAKIGVGAYIYPMRAYLEYTASVVLARPAANGAARAFAVNTVASLPETINVVIVEKGNVGTEVAGSDDASGEQTTRVIGTINTRTGEFKFANDRWFDLNGRYLGVKKPTQKGAYYNNGKKVIVK